MHPHTYLPSEVFVTRYLDHVFCVLVPQVSRLQEMLEAKQLQLREVLSGGGGDEKGPTPEERQLLQQREEYGRRGIR